MEDVTLRIRKDALIHSLLHDRDPGVRERAAFALARESRQLEPDVILMLTTALRKDEDEQVRRAVIFALDVATLTYTPNQTMVAAKQRNPSGWQRRLAALNAMSVSELLTSVGRMTVGEALMRSVAALMGLVVAGATFVGIVQNWVTAIGWFMSLFHHH